jgi:hypothetical protein
MGRGGQKNAAKKVEAVKTTKKVENETRLKKNAIMNNWLGAEKRVAANDAPMPPPAASSSSSSSATLPPFPVGEIDHMEESDSGNDLEGSGDEMRRSSSDYCNVEDDDDDDGSDDESGDSADDDDSTVDSEDNDIYAAHFPESINLARLKAKQSNSKSGRAVSSGNCVINNKRLLKQFC